MYARATRSRHHLFCPRLVPPFDETCCLRFKLLTLTLWLLAFLLAGWTLARLPLQDIAASLAIPTAGQWLGWIVLNLLIIGVFARRWQVLTTMLGIPVGFGRLLQIRQAGQTVSFLTPGPQFGGEPLQIWWLYQRCALPVHKAVLALGLDRFMELWINFAVLLLGVLVLVPAGVTMAEAPQILLILLLVLTALTLASWLVLRQPRWLGEKLEHLALRWQQHPRLHQLRGHWQLLRSDLQQSVSNQKPALASAFMLSLLGWALLFGEFALLLGFFDLALDLQGFLLIIVALRLAFLLPLPGAIGALEAAILWSFELLQLPVSAALGVIALMRLRDAVVLLAGLGCLWSLRTPDARVTTVESVAAS